jgi:DNA-binding transcriptional LysR family regulator
MELRHFRYFVAVADAMSFRKAAEVLHISQPPLSQQIMNLEHELGVSLFLREKNRIRLTTEGALFLGRAKAILAQAAEAAQEVRAAAKGETGTLNIHFISSASTGILQERVTRFRKAYPKIIIKLTQSLGTPIFRDLLEERIDIGFVRTPAICPKGVEQKLILREDYIVALPADHPLGRKKSLSPRDLQDERLIIYPRGAGPEVFDSVISIFREGGVNPTTFQETSDQFTTAGLVASGMGYAIVPECMMKIKVPGIIHRPITGGKNRAGIALVFRKQHNAIVENFVSA